MEVDCWLVWMEWRPHGLSVCLPVVILPSTTKSKRSLLLAPAHLGGLGKKSHKMVLVVSLLPVSMLLPASALLRIFRVCWTFPLYSFVCLHYCTTFSQHTPLPLYRSKRTHCVPLIKLVSIRYLTRVRWCLCQTLASKSRTAVGRLNADGESALHEACLGDRPQNVEQLLRWGLDPASTQSFRYPIHCASSVSSIRSATLRLLLLLHMS